MQAWRMFLEQTVGYKKVLWPAICPTYDLPQVDHQDELYGKVGQKHPSGHYDAPQHHHLLFTSRHDAQEGPAGGQGSCNVAVTMLPS